MVGLNQGCSVTYSKAFSSAASAVFKSAEGCDLATSSDCGELGPFANSMAMTLPWLSSTLLEKQWSAAACPGAKQSPPSLPGCLQQDRRGPEPKMPMSLVSLSLETLSESAVLPAWCACVEGRVAAPFPEGYLQE